MSFIVKDFAIICDKADGQLINKIDEPSSDRVVRFIASTDDTDRAGDVVLQEGWRMAEFARNPVILLNHDRSGLPVGKAIGYEIRDSKLLIDVEFAPSGKADEVYELVKGGFMRAVSVGFIPEKTISKSRNPDHQVFTAYPDADQVFEEQTLLELSCVTVPCNSSAVAAGLAKYYTFSATKADDNSVPAKGSASTERESEINLEVRNLIRKLRKLKNG